MNETPASGSLWYAELHYLRAEARELLERCLSEGKPQVFEGFIDQLIAYEPPRIDLLREIADELHQRLQMLRESHFAVRDQALQQLAETCGVNLGPLIPLQALDRYHLLDADMILRLALLENAVTPEVLASLRDILAESIAQAGKMYRQIKVAESLHRYLSDWVNGLSAAAARRHWNEGLGASPGADQIH